MKVGDSVIVWTDNYHTWLASLGYSAKDNLEYAREHNKRLYDGRATAMCILKIKAIK